MTAVLIPESIIQIFANEIFKINLKVADTIAKKYNLDVNDVKETLKKELQISLNIIPEEEQKFKLVKKKVNGKNTKIEDRCYARVFHKEDNEYRQCSRRKNIDCKNYCKTHSKTLPHGNI
jgi:hypothetical protein